jgi:hypothetical protein
MNRYSIWNHQKPRSKEKKYFINGQPFSKVPPKLRPSSSNWLSLQHTTLLMWKLMSLLRWKVYAEYGADGMTNHDDGDDFSRIHALWSVKRKDEQRFIRTFGMVGEGGRARGIVKTLPMCRYSATIHMQDLQKSEKPKRNCCLVHSSNQEYPNWRVKHYRYITLL